MDEATLEKDVYSFNPTKVPSTRETATATFRAGAIMTVYGSIAGALCTFWFEARTGTAFEFSFMNLVLAALFIIFALWVRCKGSFWPVGILLLLASSSALWDISYLTSYHLSKLELLLFVGPQVAILLAQIWILRAFIYLSSKGGALTETPAIQAD